MKDERKGDRHKPRTGDRHKNRAEYFRTYRKDKALGHTGARSPRFLDAPSFVAWDGEGKTLADGSHLYTLLANSRGAYIENTDGLSTEEIFQFMLAQAAAHPNARHCIFAGNYDLNMIIGDLDRQALEALYVADERGASVWFEGRGYHLGFRARKVLVLSRLGPEGPWKEKGRRFVRNTVGVPFRLWDVWGFFQGSFVATLERWFPGDELRTVVPLFDEIADMKAKRATFNAETPEDIRRYCFAEVDALEKLLDRLAVGLRNADLHPVRFDGPGAVAAALLRREGVDAHIVAPPRALASSIARAYAGGRIEITTVGNIGRAWAVDIRSAYPAAIATLPTLRGTWKRRAGEPGEFAISRIRFDFRTERVKKPSWYPLFYRTSNGSILFPANGEGWYWQPELDAARAYAAKLGGSVVVLDAWTLEPASDVRPFAFVPALYDQRALLKRTGDAAEKVLKLALNSLYGKTAQQAGGTSKREPPFFSLAYAGMITSTTRARLVHAALLAPSCVVMFATDGLFTTRRLPLAQTKGDGPLGSWEDAGAIRRLIIAQAGVYWSLTSEGEYAKFRGFDKDALATPAVVLDAWKRGAWSVEVPITRFVTLGSALASPDTFAHWRTWRTTPRALSISGGSAKRARVFELRGKPHLGPVRVSVVDNYEYDFLGEQLSAPYRVTWEDWDAESATGGTIDGAHSNDVLAEADDASLYM